MDTSAFIFSFSFTFSPTTQFWRLEECLDHILFHDLKPAICSQTKSTTLWQKLWNQAQI